MEVFGVPASSVLIILALALFGFVAHVMQKASELRDADPAFTLTAYFNRNPYRTLAKICTVLGATIGLAEPQITPLVAVGAISLGYAADSAGNRLKLLK